MTNFLQTPLFWKIITLFLAAVICVLTIEDNFIMAALAGIKTFAPAGSVRATSVALNTSSPVIDCDLSWKESDGFICEADDTWRLRRTRFIEQQPRQLSTELPVGKAFWQTNWEPDFSCENEERIGKPGDGGKWVCNPYQIRRHFQKHPEDKCIVYSVGSSNEFGFEESMHEYLPECEIFTFDHTVEDPHPPPFVKYNKWGVGGSDQPPLYTVETIRKQLNHSRVEVFKIDVEGFEYDTILPMVANQKFTGVRQLLIEFHNWGPNRAGVDHGAVHRFFQNMRDQGWVIYHKEPNIQYSDGNCIEYAFLHLNWNATELMASAKRHWCVSGWQNGACPQWGQGRRKVRRRVKV